MLRFLLTLTLAAGLSFSCAHNSKCDGKKCDMKKSSCEGKKCDLKKKKDCCKGKEEKKS
ncbi:MAG: hypothetical protein NXH75_09030 [Halobacteriovoraceae bacterium]|nr:hypothetical protein [Halobacteriovoraceae bacterium]